MIQFHIDEQEEFGVVWSESCRQGGRRREFIGVLG